MSISPAPLDPEAVAAAKKLTPRTRTSTFAFMSGLAIGALVIGLLLPFVLGEDPRDLVTSSRESGDFDFADNGDDGLPDASGADSNLPPTAAEMARQSRSSDLPADLGATDGPLTASDRGVTADTIRLGVILPDLGGLDSFGVEVGSPDARGKAQSAIDTLNAAGGILGRKVVPVYRSIDVIDQNKMRAGCLTLANDDKVFAAINVAGFYGPAIRCLTTETKTPFILSAGTSASDYSASEGYLVTIGTNGTSDSANFARDLARAGLLDGKVGVITQDGYDQGMTEGFLPVAEAMGTDVVSSYTLSNDLSSVWTQIPVAVSQFQRDGVETVILDLGGDIGSSFVRTSSSQGATWNYEGGCCLANLKDLPDSFWGAHTISASITSDEPVSGVPDDGVADECVDAYLGRSYATKFDPSDPANGDYAITAHYCTLVQAFAAAATAAGTDLTRERFVAAVPTVPAATYPAVIGPMTFKGRGDGADYHRVMVATQSCGCFEPLNDDAIRNKY